MTSPTKSAGSSKSPMKSSVKREIKAGRATRDAYGEALVELGKKHANVVVLDADLSKSTKSNVFQKAYPDRFINVGIAEANMVGIASGLAACGWIPYASSFASFLVCKAFDQLRMGVAYSELPVRVCGSHSGITLGEDGVSQMAIEDLALMTSLPTFTVIVPADEISTKPLVVKSYDLKHGAYIRTGRAKTPIIYTPEEAEKLAIGKGYILRNGGDIFIAACGIMVADALIAADELAAEGIEATVADIHTIKPIDVELIAREAAKCGAVVTAEEHQIWGGLGSAVAKVLGEQAPVPHEYVGIQDTFAESGLGEELKQKYGLTPAAIANAARKSIKRKN